MKPLNAPFLINLIGFQLLWPAAVVGAAHEMPYLAWGVLAVMLFLMGLTSAHWRRDLRMVFCGFLACLLLEPIWLSAGVIEYHQWSSRWVAPGWIWALWGGFAVSFFYCLAWLKNRPIIAALFGGVGGGISVLMGVRLGAAQAPLGEWVLMLGYGTIWAITVPVFAAVARSMMESASGDQNVYASAERRHRQTRSTHGSDDTSPSRVSNGVGDNG